ncbi:hypothetical protein [Mycolicibacterium palauense]|uniref:hypothetical protein n=1 Tax=Mycolicibacterium palauense TaxID=2034511 RepID=UPI000BFEBF96|nr:hypothetical protein [Mycolicibacterium palauense]
MNRGGERLGQSAGSLTARRGLPVCELGLPVQAVCSEEDFDGDHDRPGYDDDPMGAAARPESDTAPAEIDWDDEVDFVCAGYHGGELASGVVAAMAGFDVSVVAMPAGGPVDGRLSERFGMADPGTAAYLDALAADLPPVAVSEYDPVPVRAVDGILPGEFKRGAAVAPFYGAQLRDWAAACVGSPAVAVTSAVIDSRQTITYTAQSGPIDAMVIGTIDLPEDGAEADLRSWLIARAQPFGLTAGVVPALRSLVFDHGSVVGAMTDGPDGVRAVRAHQGVVMTGLPARPRIAVPDGVRAAEVAFVLRGASRFARLELLTLPHQR